MGGVGRILDDIVCRADAGSGQIGRLEDDLDTDRQRSSLPPANTSLPLQVTLDTERPDLGLVLFRKRLEHGLTLADIEPLMHQFRDDFFAEPVEYLIAPALLLRRHNLGARFML